MTKILVTESQYQRLFEQKKPKIEVFQDLIDNGLEYIRGFCDETLSAEEYSGDVGFDSFFVYNHCFRKENHTFFTK